MSYSIYAGKLEQISLSRKALINTINQYAYCVAEEDDAFKEALQQTDILLPDGIGIVAAVKFLNGKKINKIAGSDLHKHLLQQLDNEKGTCFYLGSSENTLEKIKNRITKEYPNIVVGSYSPPYKTLFSADDNKQMVNAINVFKPDVLFVGMTAPKQEKWAYMHKELLDAKLICSIGAAFDFYAGTTRRPAKVWRSMGMEWLIRLLKEPRRMSKRYLYYGPVFIWLLIKLKFRSAFHNNENILQTD
jgi:N-acetylglucosaminyldiphosphoundecaprenol N-acetyl-beta-D-mannosaminyltransferase